MIERFPILNARFIWNKKLFLIRGTKISLDNIIEKSRIETKDINQPIPFGINHAPFKILFVSSASWMIIQFHHIIYDHGCDTLIKNTIKDFLSDTTPTNVNKLDYFDYAEWEELNKNKLFNHSSSFWMEYLDSNYSFVELIEPLNNPKTLNTSRIYWTIKLKHKWMNRI
jgi:hypothetical protein